MKVKRQGLIVWFQHMKNLRQIKRHGHLLYASKRLKYAVLYVNFEDLEEIQMRLEKFSFISKVEHSEKPHVETIFENKKPDEAKQYDYKMGI